MKLYNIIKKNFLLLFRSKTSSIVILLGPLLVVLLIGLAFNNIGSDYLLTIGVYSDGYSNSTNVFVNGLDEQYEISKFDSNLTCIDSVKKGSSNLCIIFPKDMILDDENQDELILYVDESRVNLVDTVINKISSIIGVSSESTSKDLTASLLTTITLTRTELESDLFRAINIKQNADTLLTDASTVESDISSMNLEMGNVNLGNIDSEVEGLYSSANSIQSQALSAIDDAIAIVETEMGVNSSEYISLNSSYYYIYNKNISSDYDSIASELDSAAEEIDNVEAQLSNARTKKSNSITKINTIKSNLDSIKSDITQLKTSLEAISESISSIKVLSAESIVNPVTTTIKPITSSTNKTTYMLPFLIVLVIMFVGIMLSATSIVIDKMSLAAFRTFASPTRDSVYVLAYYITNILILGLQLLIIGGLALYFLKISFLSNIFLTALIIFLASTFFVLVGMAFGYLFKSQEGVTIASLSFSSLLLFVSNLVIPLETLPLIVQKISNYNPYVFLSELLRKSMLFKVSINEVSNELGLILLYILIVIILILVIQKLAKIVFFKKAPHKKNRNTALTVDEILRLNNDKFLRNKKDLLKFLETCENSEFREFVDHENNKFRVWLNDVLNERKLAKKLTNVTDRQTMIDIVEKDVAKGIVSR